MSYDQKCYDVAEVFLSDVQNPVSKDDAHKLAQEIQTTIEDYLQEVENRPPPALKAEIDRDTRNAVAFGKVWGEMLDNLLGPKRTP